MRAVKAIVKETEKKFKVKIEVSTAQKEKAAPPTDPKSPVSVSITRAVKELRRKTPKTIGIGGGTVAKYLREAGFPCVVWSTLDEQAHRRTNTRASRTSWPTRRCSRTSRCRIARNAPAAAEVFDSCKYQVYICPIAGETSIT